MPMHRRQAMIRNASISEKRSDAFLLCQTFQEMQIDLVIRLKLNQKKNRFLMYDLHLLELPKTRLVQMLPIC